MGYIKVFGYGYPINDLQEAAYNNDMEKVQALLKQGLSPDSTQRDQGVTPLVLACMQGHYEVAKYLLSHGANVNLSCNLPYNKKKYNPKIHIIDYKLNNLPIRYAFENDYFSFSGITITALDAASMFRRGSDLLTLLLSHVDLDNLSLKIFFKSAYQPELIDIIENLHNEPKSLREEVLLRLFFINILKQYSNLTRTAKKILSYGLDPNGRVAPHRRFGSQAYLHYAIENGLKNISLALLESGADIDLCDSQGKMPLQYLNPRFSGAFDVALPILQKGADLEAINHFKNTNLDSVRKTFLALNNYFDIQNFSDAVDKALKHHYFDESGTMISRLITKHAKLNHQGHVGLLLKTAFDCYGKILGLTDLLNIENITLPRESSREFCQTLFFAAASIGHVGVMEKILLSGLAIDVGDLSTKDSPWGIAEQNGHLGSFYLSLAKYHLASCPMVTMENKSPEREIALNYLLKIQPDSSAYPVACKILAEGLIQNWWQPEPGMELHIGQVVISQGPVKNIDDLRLLTMAYLENADQTDPEVQRLSQKYTDCCFFGFSMFDIERHAQTRGEQKIQIAKALANCRAKEFKAAQQENQRLQEKIEQLKRDYDLVKNLLQQGVALAVREDPAPKIRPS